MLWRASVLRGLLGIVAGTTLIVWPQQLLGVGAVVYGAYSIAIGLVDGGAVLLGHASGRYSKGLLIALAVANIVAGILLVTATRRTLAVVLAIVGVLLVVEGAARLVRVVREGLVGLVGWVTAAAAVCEMLVGVVFALHPLIAAVGFVAILGGVVLVYGIVGLGAGLAARAAAGVGGGPMTPV